MVFNNKKVILLIAILNVVFFCNCQPKAENASLSSQESTVEKRTARQISAIEMDAAEPAVATDSDGNVFVVYVEHNADKSADVYLQKFNRNAEMSGEKIRVNSEKGQVKAWFGDPPTIKIGTDNAIYVGWTRTVETTKTTATDLMLSVSHDGGKSFAAPVKVNDDSAPASHGMHSLALGKENRVYLAWLDERNIKTAEHAENFSGDEIIEPRKNDSVDEFQFIKAHHNSNHNSQSKPEKKPENQTTMDHKNAEPNSEVFFAGSDDGGKTFSKNIKLSSEVCPCCKTNLAVAGNGMIYVSWRQVLPGDYRHITHSENNGKSFSDYKVVSDDQWQINACPVSGAPMIFDGKSNLTIAWYTAGKAGETGIYSAKLSADGNFSPRNLIANNAASGTPAFGSNENSNDILIYESNGKIFKTNAESTQNGEFIDDGSYPVASFKNGKIYVAYVKKENGKRSVQLKIY
jgi:hypothetical protein